MNNQQKGVAVIHKQVGETPLQAIEKYRAKKHIAPETPLAYAGRLDPMAEGKLLVLIGDECKQQEKYFELDKEYILEILLGFSSDSGDVLGLPAACDADALTDTNIKHAVEGYKGDHEFEYPAFSSKTVKGKPLFMWKLEGRLGEIEIPTIKSTIYEIKVKDIRHYAAKDLRKKIFSKINSIPEVTEASKQLGADFRREAIRPMWADILSADPKRKFYSVKVSVVCTSGTYMRTLAGEIGKELGSCGLALRIKRKNLGIYKGKFLRWEKKY